MSIYVMAVYELAKKRGTPTSEFVKQLNDLGFECSSHLKKLTQADLDAISLLLNPGEQKQEPANRTEDFIAPECASVVITKIREQEYIVSAVQSSVVKGELVVEELERRTGFRSKAEALLESDLVAYKFKSDRT